jgi:hypothetical protein
LKLIFNKSGESSFPERQAARQEPPGKPQGRVMSDVTPAFTAAAQEEGRSSLFGEIKSFWREFFVKAFDPYRPELHYMRGPGPACRAKETALSPAVQSMLAEIRAAKAAKSQASS